MESKTQFIQNKTITMTFTDALATADVYIPFAVDRIHFNQIGSNSNTKAYVNVISDLVAWQSLGIFQTDDQIGTDAKVNNTVYFQTPTKIQGRYTFRALTMAGADSTALNTHGMTIIAQFIRD